MKRVYRKIVYHPAVIFSGMLCARACAQERRQIETSDRLFISQQMCRKLLEAQHALYKRDRATRDTMT